jgi:hypothetical protein
MAQSGGLRDIPNAQLNVRYWPKADMGCCTVNRYDALCAGILRVMAAGESRK